MKKDKVYKMEDLANEKQIVVKSNRLVEASYKLTVQEQRIIILVASMIKPDDEDFETYRIDVKDFMEMIGVTGHSKYKETKEITKKLRERTLVIKDTDNDQELQVGWVSSFRYFNRQGYVQIRFDPELKPYLIKLKERFTSYDLRNVLSLRSNYSIRLYELLKQYEKIGQRQFEVDELRKMLVLGEGEYKLYGHVKSRIIEVAKRELAEKTDIYFEYQEIKKGRKVHSLKFFIFENKDRKAAPKIRLPKQLPPQGVENAELFYRLTDYFLLSSVQAAQVLERFGEEQILANLAYVEEKYKQGDISNLGAYTLKAIEGNYYVQPSLFDLERKQREAEAKRKKEQEQLERNLEDQYNQLIEDFKQSLAEDRLQELEVQALEDAEQNPEFVKLKKLSGSRMFVRIALKRRLAAEAGLPSLEDWKNQQLEQSATLPVNESVAGKQLLN
jgi:hypothetical protein